MPSGTYGATPVLALELDRNGSVAKKAMRLDRETQLTNSLLQGLHPGIRVATVDVPTEPLDACEQAMVEQALTRLDLDGTRYCLVGARQRQERQVLRCRKLPGKEAGGAVPILAAGRHDLFRHFGVLVQGHYRGAGLSRDGGGRP